MSKLAIKRRIVLTQSDFGLRDEATFSVPWTIWAQLRAMIARECGSEVAESSIPDGDGRMVSEWIIRKHVNLAAVDDETPEAFTTPQQMEALDWLTLLTLWGDEEGIRTAELAEFLQGGEVVVEELA